MAPLPDPETDSRRARLQLLAGLVAQGVAGTALAALIAGEAGRAFPSLDLLTVGAPLWLALAVIVLAASPCLGPGRGRRRAQVLAVGAVLLGACKIGPEALRPIPGPAPAPAPGATIKLIQFNAWEHNPDPERAAAWLAAQAPDIITLEDAEPPIRSALIRRGYHFTRGIADTAIFSRALPVSSGVVVPQALWPRLPSFARASFMTPRGPFTVFAVHLQRPYQSDTRPAIAALGDLLDHYDRSRVIVAGDFNLVPWSAGLQGADARLGLRRRDRALATWPTPPRAGATWPWPVLPIDHVYAGDRLTSSAPQRGASLGSDHASVVVAFQLR